MIISVHQPQYLPWLGYFDKIHKSDCFVFLDTVQYKVREYQNRNRIRTKDGELWLTVPVLSKGQGFQSINEVHIDNSSDWQKSHLGSLKSFYGKAPFFEEHLPFFEDVYSTHWDRLIDLNIHIIKYLLKPFKINTIVKYESEIGTSQTSTDRIVEICQKCDADTYFSGQGGREYLKEDKFKEAGIDLQYQEFQHPSYGQLFVDDNNPFIPNLSAIDLLFNCGEKNIDQLRG